MSKLRLLLAGFVLLSASLTVVRAAENEPLTVILVRHAEKAVVPPENVDPDLSEAGQARAVELARMFREAGLSAVFATQLKRTQQTAAPLAAATKLKPEIFGARDTAGLAKALLARSGQTVLVVGHNNTVPLLIRELGGPQLEVIPESEYDRLYVLHRQADGRVQLLQLRYGASSL